LKPATLKLGAQNLAADRGAPSKRRGFAASRRSPKGAERGALRIQPQTLGPSPKRQTKKAVKRLTSPDHGPEFPVTGARHPAPHCGCGLAEADVETDSAPTRNTREDRGLTFEWQAISRRGGREMFTKAQR
jgi:hypothetical protein